MPTDPPRLPERAEPSEWTRERERVAGDFIAALFLHGYNTAVASDQLTDLLAERERSAREAGFWEGIEAAAKWHEECAESCDDAMRSASSARHRDENEDMALRHRHYAADHRALPTPEKEPKR